MPRPNRWKRGSRASSTRFPRSPGCATCSLQLLALPEELTTAEQRETWGKLLADFRRCPLCRQGRQPALSARPDIHQACELREYRVVCRLPVPPVRGRQAGPGGGQAAYEQRRFPGPTCWSWDPQSRPARIDRRRPEVRSRQLHLHRHASRPSGSPVTTGSPILTTAARECRHCSGCSCNARASAFNFCRPGLPVGTPTSSSAQPDGVRASVRNGKVVELQVTPELRRADVIVER